MLHFKGSKLAIFAAVYLLSAGFNGRAHAARVVIGAPEPYPTPGNGVDVGWFVEYDQWLAQGFTTPDDAVRVWSLKLWFDSQTNIEPSIGNFIVSLNTTTISGNPSATALWTTTVDNPSGLITFNLKGLTLAPTTGYFVSVTNLQSSGVPPDGTPAITTWLLSNDKLLGNVDPSFYLSGGPGGFPWRIAGIPAHGAYPLEFEVLGNSITPHAVPETSTWGMMLLGFAGLGLVGRLSQRRARAG